MGLKRKSISDEDKKKKKTKTETATTSMKNDKVLSFQTTQSSLEKPSWASSSYSAEACAEIIGGNHDLLSQILIPTPDLWRLRSVSKTWNSVISDPYFSRRWHNKNLVVSGLFFRRYIPKPLLRVGPRERHTYLYINIDGKEKERGVTNTLFDTDQKKEDDKKSMALPFNFINSTSKDVFPLIIIQSCNGLLFCSSPSFTTTHNPDLAHLQPFEFYVHNPTTEEYDRLSIPCRLLSASLAFDPLKSPHYKALFLCTKWYMLFSSKNDSWVVAKYPRTIQEDLVMEAAVFLNDAIHWPCERSSTSLYFNVETEEFFDMPMPPIQGGQEKRTLRYFGESGGRLQLVDFNDPSTLKFDVFVLERNYSEWIAKYRVDLNRLCKRMQKFTILSIVCRDDAEDKDDNSQLLIYAGGKVASYNLTSNSLKIVCKLKLSVYDVRNLQQIKWLGVHQFIKIKNNVKLGRMY